MGVSGCGEPSRSGWGWDREFHDDGAGACGTGSTWGGGRAGRCMEGKGGRVFGEGCLGRAGRCMEGAEGGGGGVRGEGGCVVGIRIRMGMGMGIGEEKEGQGASGDWEGHGR